MPDNGGRITTRETYSIRKFDGEYIEGMEPAETIEIEIEDGRIVKIKTVKGSENNGVHERIP